MDHVWTRTNTETVSGITDRTIDLVEWVSAGSPPGEEQAQSNCLEHARYGADSHGIKRPLLSEELADELIDLLAFCLRILMNRLFGGKRTAGAELAKKINVPR